MAIVAGASGVGVGSMVNKLTSRQAMYLAVGALARSIGLEEASKEGAEFVSQGIEAEVAASQFVQL
jgi:hypothetical protein